MSSGMQRNCKNCNTIITKKVNCSLKTWESTVRFCSRACHDIYRQGKKSASPQTTFKKGHKTVIGYVRRGAENNKWKGGQIEKACLICSKNFRVDRYRANAKTCSIECSKLYRKSEEFRLHLSEIQRSKISEEMKVVHDILTQFISSVRKSARYGIWRERIFKRDNFTCQLCGKRGGKLQADHIEAVSVIIVKNKIKTYEEAMACSELWNLANGRTLCRPCHYKTPTFGSKALTLLANYTYL